MKKAFLAISLATTILGLGGCSELTGTKEAPVSYTQKEVNENALKVAKRALKNLDNKDVEKLNEDVAMVDGSSTFLNWTRTDDGLKNDLWDTEQFVEKYGDYQYASHTTLSLIPSSDWSDVFLDAKDRYQALVLAQYTGETSENLSLVIPVVVEKDGNEFKVDTIECFDGGYIGALNNNVQEKYKNKSLPSKVNTSQESSTDSGYYVEDTILLSAIKNIQEIDTESFGDKVISVQRRSDDEFLVKTDKVETIIKFKNMGEVEKYAWQATRYGSGEVLWNSSEWK